ncbi:hypothetical protein ECG_06975 [Echinococcus granulosus]|uniref:Cysteine rich secretory protein LCCL n=1 Tax=Echinococcus granulosus TaxID=6210 RepID=A0A068WZH5_ECHGR|nr:hypothetical protein ECG_06975 [Echinococcus granulosus]CDS23072.1 cysteine rich secretory protein LCCL [Echinococcus granulosus]
MARYEMPIIIKALGDEGVKAALKRHILRLLDNDQVIFDVKNLGLKRLPQVYRAGGEKQRYPKKITGSLSATPAKLMMGGVPHVRLQMLPHASSARSGTQTTRRQQRLDTGSALSRAYSVPHIGGEAHPSAPPLGTITPCSC